MLQKKYNVKSEYERHILFKKMKLIRPTVSEELVHKNRDTGWLSVILLDSIRRQPVAGAFTSVEHVTDLNSCQSFARRTKATAVRLLHLVKKTKQNIDSTSLIIN